MQTGSHAGGLTAFLQGLTVTNTATGVVIGGGIYRGPGPGFLLVSDSTITGTSKAIVSEQTITSLAPTVVLDGVTATGNGAGLATVAARMRLSHSTIAGNGAGVSMSGSEMSSDGTNRIVDNGAKASGGTITIAPRE